VAFATVPRVGRTQSKEIENQWIDLTAGTTLWGVVVFQGDELVEVSIGAGSNPTTVRGRFNGRRLIEYAWRNATGTTQRVGIQARAVGTRRDLRADNVRFWGDNVVIGFGSRPVPGAREDRMGAYPHDAVVIGFRADV
jgi:hypothetical protein